MWGGSTGKKEENGQRNALLREIKNPTQDSTVGRSHFLPHLFVCVFLGGGIIYMFMKARG